MHKGYHMPHDYSEEDTARSVSEDRRLVEMGIDPDGDPVDRMATIDRRRAELKLKAEAQHAADLAYLAAEKAMKVDRTSGS
jgi:hypothetical protein